MLSAIRLRRSRRVEHGLLRAVGDGSTAAFDELYERLSVTTYSLCRLLADRPENATVLMNAAWLHVWRHASSLALEEGSTQAIVLRVVARIATA